MSTPRRLQFMGFLACLLIGFSCGEEKLIGPADRSIGVAGKPSSGDPTVNSTDPAGAPVDTTLVVRVLGTGYDAGSTAEFAIDSQAVPQVRTNSTTFVSSRELRANITIDADAPTDLYDVIVTTSKGKRGIGIERFEVFVTVTQLDPQGNGSSAWAVSGLGEVAGDSEARRGPRHAFFWSELGGMEDVGPGSVHDMSDTGRIIGNIDFDATRAIVWTRLGPNSWVSEALPSPPVDRVYALGINPTGDRIVGSVDAKPAVWDLRVQTWTLTMLPVDPDGPACSALAVNDAGLIAGTTGAAGCVWIELAGAWTMHILESPSNAPEGVMAGAINASGDLLGRTRDTGTARPILWHRTATEWSGPVEVPLIPPGSLVAGLSDSGTIAGSYIRDGNWRAFACCSGGFRDLGSAGGNSSHARAIAGRYVAGSSGANGKWRPVRWTVP